MIRKRSIVSAERKPTTEIVGNVTAFRGGIFPELNNGLQRVGHTLLVYKKDLYLFGGYGPKNLYLNFIYCNVKMTLQWKEIRGVGVVPGGRANHSAILHENKMVVYGGHKNLDVFDDLYAVNLDTMRWEKINYDNGQGPGPLFSHTAVYVPSTQAMIIIGGFHQRPHNIYIAHSFDLRHSVWNGIRGPPSVNPLHIQLCSAAYHGVSNSLIVIGLVESDALSTPAYDVPSVYMMNVYSGAWVKVKTTVLPENIASLRVSGVWEYFMREVVTMGGIYDTERQEWYFPILLGPIEAILSARKMEKISTTTTFEKNRQRTKTNMYGFLRLQMSDMTWSVVSTTFPKRVIAEVLSRGLSKSVTQGERRESGGRRREKMLLSKKQTFLLYSSNGVSRFQRKYAYAFIDFSGHRRQRTRQRALIMHGGINLDDYIALLFTPILESRHSVSANSLESLQLSGEACTVSFASSPQRAKLVEQATKWWDNKDDDSFSFEESELSRVMSDVKQETNSVTPTAVVTDINLMAGRQHRLNSDPSLLPLLPSSRNAKNSRRFAILYHSRSAVHTNKVLPDLSCPVAVINSKDETEAWGGNYYSETRQWIATLLAAEKERERMLRRSMRKAVTSKSRTFSSDDDRYSSESTDSRALVDTRSTRSSLSTRTPNNMEKPKDFFLEKNLEVFDLRDFEIQGNLQGSDCSISLSDFEEEKIGRLNITVKRNKEVQRLPESVFQRASVGNVTDAGSAAAYKLMLDALARIDPSDVSDRQRALIRWRYLRVMVLNGEASYIMHRVRVQEGDKRALIFSGTKRLLFAPDLRVRNSDRQLVSCKPIPYSLPADPAQRFCSSEITPSGYVMYHLINNVK